MRHRFHSICSYFAMFPETFVEKHLAASPHDGVVFDPYCGRGTTIFQALIQGRSAAGCDLNPVAVCISGAKGEPPALSEARSRIDELRRGWSEPGDDGWQGDIVEFFELCFHQETTTSFRGRCATCGPCLTGATAGTTGSLQRYVLVRCTGSRIARPTASVTACHGRSVPSRTIRCDGGDGVGTPRHREMYSRSSNGCSNTGFVRVRPKESRMLFKPTLVRPRTASQDSPAK